MPHYQSPATTAVRIISTGSAHHYTYHYKASVKPYRFTMSTLAMQPAIKNVRGWLIVLILWFAFWIPVGVQEDLEAIEKFFAPMVAQNPALNTLFTVCFVLLWSALIVSIYCAYVLAFRKPGAPVVARRGLVLIVLLKLSFYGVVLLLVQPAFREIASNGLGRLAYPALSREPFGFLVKPLVWLAIWFTYLVRSKRVSETYVA